MQYNSLLWSSILYFSPTRDFPHVQQLKYSGRKCKPFTVIHLSRMGSPETWHLKETHLRVDKHTKKGNMSPTADRTGRSSLYRSRYRFDEQSIVFRRGVVNRIRIWNVRDETFCPMRWYTGQLSSLHNSRMVGPAKCQIRSTWFSWGIWNDFFWYVLGRLSLCHRVFYLQIGRVWWRSVAVS